MSTEIYPIIAPPRTCSTMLGASMNMNSRIDGYCHEPFFRLRYNPTVTKESYDEIKRSGNHVVVKEMTQWLDINDEYKRFFSVADKPPVFLLRNPIMATEDKLRKVVETFDMRKKKAIDDQLENIGVNSLDEYAIVKGFPSWRDMITKSFRNRDYVCFGEILKNEDLFSLWALGWESLKKQIEFLKDNNMRFMVVEATKHRENPVESTKNICRFWGLKFESRMVNWGKGKLKINTGQNERYQRIWYEYLMESAGIEPPNEPLLEPTMLPEFIEAYIRDVCIPIYNEFVYLALVI